MGGRGEGYGYNPRRVIMWFQRQNNAITEEILIRLANMEAKFVSMDTNINSLRGLVNRKLGNSNPSNGDEQTETNKNDDGLDSLRKLYHGSQKGTPHI